jgi:general secretion pathway protein G
MKNRARSQGFTLIELLVVVAIIGIVVGAAVGQYQRSILKAKEAVLKQDLYVMRTSIHQYFADKGKWPQDLQTLVDDRYLTKIPKDPITDSDQTWETVFSMPEEQDISLEPGIEDVRSGSTDIAMDGSVYADW